MNKVIVIGSPGAGKTTFSRRLADMTHLPIHHLDYYYHDSHFEYQNDRRRWREKITELVSNPTWIIDGNYKSTFDIRFPKADTIIYLDYGTGTALRRALKRRIVLHGKVRDDMPSNWREKLTFELFRFIWSYNKLERPKVYELLSAQKNKDIVILHNSREADTYLSTLN